MMTEAQMRRQLRLLGLVAWGLMGLTYALLFASFSDQNLMSVLQRAVINVVPAALLGFLIAKITESYLIGRPVISQIAAHAALALMFGTLWYVGIQTGYGLQHGWAQSGLIGRPLIGTALAWQSFQGAAVYAAIVGFVYAGHYRLALLVAHDRIEALETVQSKAKSLSPLAAPIQVMVKDGASLKPVSVTDILALSGAGDYTEVITKSGTHLSNTSLSDFERELSTRDFARVHRSHIVRMDAVLSVESAGNGRLTLHLPAGLSITTSRAGAQRVKQKAL